MHLQIGRSHTRFVCAGEEQVALRKTFDRCHCLVLPAFLDAALLDHVRREIRNADVGELTHGVGHEMVVKADRARALLELLLNDQTLFDAVDALTACGSIGCFKGRIYEMRRGGNHEFDWHDDVIEDRLIAMSVNLGSDRYEGGVLQIADAASKVILHTVTNVGAGDAVIFRVAPALIHRVTPVESVVPKVAYAGWFCSRPSYREVLEGWSQAAMTRADQSKA